MTHDTSQAPDQAPDQGYGSVALADPAPPPGTPPQVGQVAPAPAPGGAGVAALGGPTTGVRAAGWVGRVLLVLGGLVVAFLGYQLWGTGLHEQRAQRDLAAELDRAIEAQQQAVATPPGDPGDPAGPATVAGGGSDGAAGVLAPAGVGGHPLTVPARLRPASADPVARITAPTIGLDKIVVEGVGRTQLGVGPGHYPVTPLPGHAGNVAIAGHRTTHGAPFADIDDLQPGDPIILDTVDGRFVYRVEANTDPVDGTVSGHRVVAPGEANVIAATGDNRLTLTTCHPRYSDRQRLVVTAVLEGSPVAFAAPPVPPEAATGWLGPATSPAIGPAADPTADPADFAHDDATNEPPSFTAEPFGWHWNELPMVVLWMAMALASCGPSIALFRRHRRAVAAAMVLVLPVFPLFVLFSHLDLLLPSG